MKLKIKFKNKEAYETCRTFINGNGFCFRTRSEDKIIEFSYEYTALQVASMCDNTTGLKNQFELV